MEIGIDIIENSRLKEKLKTPNFLETILTPIELAEYHTKKGKKALEYLAGRFAAKEAIIKAVHTHASPHFLEIEILTRPDGSPEPHYKNFNLKLSISHEAHYTVAAAILL